MTEPSTYNYRLDLRPLDFFFFGGEITFGNGEEVNYYARTRKYPPANNLTRRPAPRRLPLPENRQRANWG